MSGLNLRKYQHQAEEMKRGGGGGGNFRRLQDGRTILRFFTFEHTVTEDDYTHGIYDRSSLVLSPDVGTDSLELEREVWVHYTGDGPPINCARTPDNTECLHCDIAERAIRASKAAGKTEQREARRMGRRAQYWINGIDVVEQAEGMGLYQLPTSVYRSIIDIITQVDEDGEPEYPSEDIFGCDGRDFIIERDSNLPPSQMYKVQLRDAKRSKTLPDEFESDVTDLHLMESLHPGWSSGNENSGAEDQDEKSKESKEEPPATTQKKTAKKTKKKTTKKTTKKQTGFAVGISVEFKDDDDTHTGKITDVNDDGTFEIETEDSYWTLPEAQLTLIK